MDGEAEITNPQGLPSPPGVPSKPLYSCRADVVLDRQHWYHSTIQCVGTAMLYSVGVLVGSQINLAEIIPSADTVRVPNLTVMSSVAIEQW